MKKKVTKPLALVEGELDLPQLFAHFVISDLKRNRIADKKIVRLLQATISTTFAFLRTERHKLLSHYPNAARFAERQDEIEKRMLKALSAAVPRRTRKGLRGATLMRFLEIWLLRDQRRTWNQISADLRKRGQYIEPQSVQKFYNRRLLEFLDMLRAYLVPDFPRKKFLATALPLARGHAGRPRKSGQRFYIN